MKKTSMIAAILAIITMGLAIPLSAQVLPVLPDVPTFPTSPTLPASPTSNQNKATAGVFGADVDNYMNVDNYGDVNFNKWFGYLGGSTNGVFNLGYATRFGGKSGEGESGGGNGIYLGTYYTGNLFTTGTDETTRLTTTWDPVLQQLLTKADEKIYTWTYTDTNNNIAALVGLTGLNMGIKVGFYENMRTFNTPYNVNRNGTSTVTQNVDGSITYSNNDSLSYELSDGNMMPYLQWGMKLKVGSYNLLPRAYAGVNFSEDKFIDDYYGANRTEYQGNFIGTENIQRRGYDNGYTGLTIGAGADFYLDDTMYVGLDYYLGTNIYDRSFSAIGKSVSVKGTINWNNANNNSTKNDYFDRTVKNDSAQIAVSEQSNMNHFITPVFGKEWKEKLFGENLKLGILVQLPMSITSRTVSNYTDAWTKNETVYKNTNDLQNNTTTITEAHTAGTKTETSEFNISPTVGVGVSYDLIPKKFTLNAGINVNVPSFTSTSTVTSRNGVDSNYTKTEIGYGSGKYTSNETLTVTLPGTIVDSVRTQTRWYGLSGSLAGGFVFSFNDNFALDMLFNYGNGFDIDIYEWNVLFSIKF
jgi:hypothetical protein